MGNLYQPAYIQQEGHSQKQHSGDETNVQWFQRRCLRLALLLLVVDDRQLRWARALELQLQSECNTCGGGCPQAHLPGKVGR